MDDMMKTLLTLSVSGGALALMWFGLKPLLERKLPKSVQYYVLLLMLLRMVLPLPGLRPAVLPTIHEPRPIESTVYVEEVQENFTEVINHPKREAALAVQPLKKAAEQASPPAQAARSTDVFDIRPFLTKMLMPLWAIGAAISLFYRFLCYAYFFVNLKRRTKSISNDQARVLTEMKRKMGIAADVSMLVSPLASVPMLVGIVRPRIILPEMDLREEQLKSILLHELTHLRRRDVWIKWFATIVISLHWFNPIVYFIQRELNRACELSCDEAVIKHLDTLGKQRYGDALIDMAKAGIRPYGVISTAMSGKYSTLRERLVYIMEYRKPTKKIIALSLCLILFFLSCAGMLGVAAQVPAEVTEPSGKIVKLATGGGVHGALYDTGEFILWGVSYDSRLNVPEGLPPIKDIALGQYHAVALDIDGKLHGWTENVTGVWDYSEIAFEDDLPPFVQITANAYHTAAITADGRIYKWGNANQGNQEAVPQDLGQVFQVAMSAHITTVLLADGRISAWGDIDSDLGELPVKAVQVACSSGSVYALGEDGKVYGEEMQANKQLDFIEKPDMDGIVKIVGSMALDKDGSVYAWGQINPYKNTNITDVPLNLPEIVDIATDNMNALALGADGKIYEWGYNSRSTSGEDNTRQNYVALPKNLDGFHEKAPEYREMATEEIMETMVVKDYEAFRNAANAYPLCKKIVVDGSFTIEHDIVVADAAIVINEGVVITIEALNCGFYGPVENHGEIIVRERLLFDDEPQPYDGVTHSISAENITIEGGECAVYAVVLNSDDIMKYIGDNTAYNCILSTPGDITTLVIDKDITIPEGFKLTLNANVTLEVLEGVTLSNHGTIETHYKPVIKGNLIGKKIAW